MADRIVGTEYGEQITTEGKLNIGTGNQCVAYDYNPGNEANNLNMDTRDVVNGVSMDTKEALDNVRMNIEDVKKSLRGDTKDNKKVYGHMKDTGYKAMGLRWRPTLNYLGLMLATRVGPSFGHEPVKTSPEQPEPADFSLCILLLMATVFGWWLRGLIGTRLQCISAGSLAWPFSGWIDFSRSSNSMREGPDEVLQGIQEDCFSPQDFPSRMETGLNRRHRRHNNAAEQQPSASSDEQHVRHTAEVRDVRPEVETGRPSRTVQTQAPVKYAWRLQQPPLAEREHGCWVSP
jgi:hypothetical protein